MPAYTANPTTDAERDITKRYGKVLGSAVNPVLREGNSDRHVAAPVKAFAAKNPHTLLPWPKKSVARVVSMRRGDFYGSEQSTTLPKATSVRIELLPRSGGAPSVLRAGLKLQAGEIIDASALSMSALKSFYAAAFAEAKAAGALVSLHLKATMMKVSDPVMFGAAVETYYAPVFEKHAGVISELKVEPSLGWAACLKKLSSHTLPNTWAKILADITACERAAAPLAMVDTRRGVTNLHVPSDVIVDASMPCVVRDGGKMWSPKGTLQDTHALIPDRCYAGVFDAMLRDVAAQGQFDVTSMGSTSNVGLMAQKAEEYGSHDKTFIVKEAGIVRVVEEGEGGAVLFQHVCDAGDIWRMCQTKDAPVKDWVGLAVTKARQSGTPAIFWLDPARPHDAEMRKKVDAYLAALDLTGCRISVMSPEAATLATCARVRAGKDTISVTGNVLRDYLTDLFPILELGSSSKMNSVVPMMAGGAMYETGAGGTAPKLLQMFLEDNFLRWDSLGEYLALAAALEDLGHRGGDARALTLGASLGSAVGRILDEKRSPGGGPGGGAVDNRGTGFFLALYWAQALAAKDPSPTFKRLADELEAAQESVLKELEEFRRGPAKLDLGGYWLVDEEKAKRAMRPSPTFNAIIDKI